MMTPTTTTQGDAMPMTMVVLQFPCDWMHRMSFRDKLRVPLSSVVMAPHPRQPPTVFDCSLQPLLIVDFFHFLHLYSCIHPPHLHQYSPHTSLGANSKPVPFFALYYGANYSCCGGNQTKESAGIIANSV
jgi:hypothetical protein